MRKRPFRLTFEANGLLINEAVLRARSLTIKEIAGKIGASRTFVQEHLARMVSEMRERQKVVPRGTIEITINGFVTEEVVHDVVNDLKNTIESEDRI
jgi:predicted transcriptional regulator